MDLIDHHQLDTKEQFEKIMDPLPIMVRACYKNGEVQYLNVAWKQLTGNHSLWSSKIHQDYRDAYQEVLAHHANVKTAFKTKYKFLDKTGVYRLLADQSQPWYSSEGSYLGFICYTMDISQFSTDTFEEVDIAVLHREQALNEELEASNEELSVTNEELQASQQELSIAKDNLEQILNMLPASVVVIRGQDLIVEMINDSNLAYWKKSKYEVLGKPFLEILPDLADQPFASQLRRVMETGEIIDVKESPVVFENLDGSIRETFVDYTYQPLSDLEGNFTGVLVMSFEITDRVLSRKLMEKYSEELGLANAQLHTINEELAMSEARFKYLIQEAPVAIGVLHSRELIVESANVKILDVWGKTSKIIGTPLSTALPELQGQPFLGILDQVYTSGEPFYANEIRSLLEHDGALKEIFFNVTYQPIADSTGKTADIMVVAVDVTEQVNARKTVEQSEQHFRHLADLVPAKISNALPSGEVTFFNQQWLDFAGMRFEDLRDFGYHQMMHPEEISPFQVGLAQAAATGIPHTSEMRFKNIQGKYVWHLNIASPIFDENGSIKMWVGSTTDIQKIKEEEQRKGDFVSMLSHELKTPVTTIKGHIQLLLRTLNKETDSALTEKLRPSMSRIDVLLTQLTGLITDMLDLTRIETGRLDLRVETLLLNSLLTEVVDDFKLSNQQHKFNLSMESEVEVNVDKHKISQVLINLIANAIKYAPNSNVIDVSMLTMDNNVLVRIRDYGIGIEEKDQEKIFDRFYRVEGQNESHYSGFGIGLYLAYSIISAHKGKITLESTKGEGSTFTIHLPL
jgi:PAS domain S-box-containing protein